MFTFKNVECLNEAERMQQARDQIIAELAEDHVARPIDRDDAYKQIMPQAFLECEV